MIDGVFGEDASGALRFDQAPPPTHADMDGILAVIERRVHRHLGYSAAEAGGCSIDTEDSWVDREPVLAGIAASSVQGSAALGPRRGAVRRCGRSPLAAVPMPETRQPCHARQHGFDLRAGVVVPARNRARLEGEAPGT